MNIAQMLAYGPTIKSYAPVPKVRRSPEEWIVLILSTLGDKQMTTVQIAEVLKVDDIKNFRKIMTRTEQLNMIKRVSHEYQRGAITWSKS